VKVSVSGPGTVQAGGPGIAVTVVIRNPVGDTDYSDLEPQLLLQVPNLPAGEVHLSGPAGIVPLRPNGDTATPSRSSAPVTDRPPVPPRPIGQAAPSRSRSDCASTEPPLPPFPPPSSSM
jgi:hypothetical protein